MYLGADASRELARAVAAKAGSYKRTGLWIAPSSPFLGTVSEAVKGTAVQVGAQNVHWESEGAFTGEISVKDLSDCGCTFAIVGHSERRLLCNETSEMVARRACFALSQGLSTIICLGETFEQRKSGQTELVLEAELEPVLSALSRDLLSRVWIAYEPVWAIGTGRYPDNSEILSAHSCIAESFYRRFKHSPKILYGGSVTPENFAAILQVENVSGALVGRASLKADQFLALASIAEQR